MASGRVAIDWNRYKEEFRLAAQKVQERIDNAPIKVEAQWMCNCGQTHRGQVSIDSEEELELYLHRTSSQPSVQILNIWRNENGIR